MSLRQAMVAVVASAALIGGIAAFSGSDDGRSVALSPGQTTTTIPLTGGTSLAPGPISPDVTSVLDTATLDTATLDTATLGTGALGTGLVETAPIDTAALDTSPLDTAALGTAATAGPATSGSAASGGAVATDPGTAVTTGGDIPVAAGAPAVNATAYAVYDSTNGRWLAGNQADAPLPVGSVMKLLTSYVVLNAGDPTKVVTVPQLQIDINESAIGLYAGEQLPRDVLFRAMIIVSANDAARALATDIGGSVEGFVQMMNDAASRLGLTNTVAANPIGLDAAGAHSSARDVIGLAALLMQDQTFRDAVAKQQATLHKQTFPNTNRLLTTYDGADGVKTGHTTDAGYCLVGSATRNGRRIIVAVLGAPSEDQRFADAAALLDWGFAQP